MKNALKIIVLIALLAPIQITPMMTKRTLLSSNQNKNKNNKHNYYNNHQNKSSQKKGFSSKSKKTTSIGLFTATLATATASTMHLKREIEEFGSECEKTAKKELHKSVNHSKSSKCSILLRALKVYTVNGGLPPLSSCEAKKRKDKTLNNIKDIVSSKEFKNKIAEPITPSRELTVKVIQSTAFATALGLMVQQFYS